MKPLTIMLTFVLGFVLGLPDAPPMPKGEPICKNANFTICPDLTGFKVYHRVDETLLERTGALAQARLLYGGICVITYTKARLPYYVVLHEMNHCRGWAHKGAGHPNVDDDWPVWKDAFRFIPRGD